MRVILWFYKPLEAESTAQRIQDSLKIYHLPAIVTGLIEFQKAQCFFMLAIQAAAIVVMKSGTLTASTYAQAQLNYILLHVIAINGYLPVTFTLMCLRNFAKKSWYMYLLTTCTVILSVVTLNMALAEIGSPNSISPSDTYQDCGTSSPAIFCNLQDTGYPMEDDISYTLYFCASVLCLLLLDKLKVTRWAATLRILKWLQDIKLWRKTVLFAKYFNHYMKQIDIPYWTRGRALTLDKSRGFRFLTFDWFIPVYLNYFSYQIMELSFFSSIGVIDTRNWSFGQIVAVTVWFPALFEYFYLEFCKSISYLITPLHSC